MAKKRQTNQPTEQPSAPVHIDPHAETLLIRYPQSGEVQAVGDMSIEKDRVTVVRSAPTVKNAPGLYKVDDSQFIANAINKLRMAEKDVKNAPELFIVPLAEVGNIAASLMKLQVDKEDAEGLKAYRAHIAYANQLEKVQHDVAKMPLAQMKHLGLDVEEMFRNGTINQLKFGLETDPVYTLNIDLAEGVQAQGKYSLMLVHDEKGLTKLIARSPLAIPEFEADERLRMEITSEEAQRLKAGKPLGRLIKNDEGQYCFAAFNRRTNRMVYVPKDEVKAIGWAQNGYINQTKQNDLMLGAKVRVEDCYYRGMEDNKFFGDVQFNPLTRQFEMSNQHYSSLYIPKWLRDNLSDSERMTDLMNHQIVDGRRFKTASGKSLNCYIRLNDQRNTVDYLSYAQVQELKRQETQTQQQAQQQGYSRGHSM